MPGSRSNHYAAYVGPSQAEAEAGTSIKKRVWSALRVKQAITAGSPSSDLVDDTTPQLGGNLDVNGQSIVSASNGDIPITPDGSGDIVLDGQKWPQADGTNTEILQTDGLGQTSWVTKPAGSGDALPIVDTTNIVKGSADAPKQIRLEADTNITTGTTRVITMADADIDLTPGTGSYATEAEGALAASALQSLAGDATPQLGGDLDLNGNNIDFPSTPNVSDCLDEDNMASDSATALATQQSIKAYVDAAGGGGPTLGTEQSASGTSVDFTGIPSGTKRIVVQFFGVSQDSAGTYIIIQLGDSGGFETSGYLGSVSGLTSAITTENITAGCPVTRSTGAAGVIHGSITLTLEDSTAFTWVSMGVLAHSNIAATIVSAGSKSLSAELTQIRITTVAGSAQFDAGAFNILYD